MKRSVMIDGRELRSEAPNYLGSHVSLHVAIRFKQEARKRGLSLNVFVRKILTTIANDNMFKAVMDDD